MKLDERHLIQLAAVVQTGSVTEGAELLGMETCGNRAKAARHYARRKDRKVT